MNDLNMKKKEKLCIWTKHLCFIGIFIIVFINLLQQIEVSAEATDFQIKDGVLLEYTGTDMDVVIPDGVTVIGKEVFMDSKIESVVIPDTVTRIEDSAFLRCSYLESVDFSDNISYIGTYVFQGTKWLENELKKNPMVIRNEVLISADVRGDVVIPDGITCIAGMAFYWCENMTSVKIPESITSIGEDAFSLCKNLKSVNFSNTTSLKKIEKNTFSFCSNLESIHIPKGVTVIEDYAFVSCTSLEEVIMPDSVITIGNHAFEECDMLTRVDIPDSVTSIGTHAFNCWNLCTVVVPGSVTEFGSDVFGPYWKIVMHGENGSYAQSYAIENKIRFHVKKEGENIITYVCDSGYNDRRNVVSYTEPGVVFYDAIRDEVVYDGKKYKYIFDGWYTDKEYTNRITCIEEGMTGDLILYAKWLKQCTITFHENGGKNLSQKSILVTENSTYGTLPTVTRKGYIFTGWYTQKNGGSKVKDNTTVTSDHTLYAQWKKVTKPSKVKISKAVLTGKKKAKSRQLKLKWKKVSGAKGYEILYHNGKGFKKAKKITTISLSRTIKSLKKGKRYYVKIRAYKLDSAGKKVYGAYSSIKKVK